VDVAREYYADVDRSQVSPRVPDDPKVPIIPGSRTKQGLPAHPIVDANTGQVIGQQPFLAGPPLYAIGHFSTTKAFTHLEIWRFVTFQFLHANFDHILLNMIGLFFFGPIAERYLASRRLFLAFYLTCGIIGAFVYLLLNLSGFLGMQGWTPLVGASAGVFGVLMAAAYLARNEMMLVFFVIPMKVRTGVYLFVAIAAINLIMRGQNAGGDAAHLGGAAAGAFFIRKPHLLLDFFDDFLFFGKRPEGRAGPGWSGGRKRGRRGGRGGGGGSRKVDAILEKVREHGMQSLSEKEKRILQKATEEQRGG